MVFVDHAFAPSPLTLNGSPPADTKALPPTPPPMPSSPSGGPVAFGIEGDPNFSKLSERDRELHLWAIAQPRNQKALQANHEIVPECTASADAISKEHPHPLGDKPLVDISTDENLGPEYVKLQNALLSLSQNSKQIVAEKSSHFVIIDRPDVVIDGVRQAVQSARNNRKL